MPLYDIALDPATGDLPTVSRFITGAELVVQRARIRLATFFGEWILDQFVGLPYLAWRAQKPPDLSGQAAVIIAELQATPGILRVSELSSSFNAETRTVTHAGTCVVQDGETVDGIAYAFVVSAGGNATPAVVGFYPSGMVRPW